jgi:hypothetical protein
LCPRLFFNDSGTGISERIFIREHCNETITGLAERENIIKTEPPKQKNLQKYVLQVLFLIQKRGSYDSGRNH